jgi:hypothetical protein
MLHIPTLRSLMVNDSKDYHGALMNRYLISKLRSFGQKANEAPPDRVNMNCLAQVRVYRTYAT